MPTPAPSSVTRRAIVRLASAVFAVCIISAMIFADSEIRPGNVAALIADFPQLQHSVPASIGIALAPVGRPAAPLSLGGLQIGPAWSTIKVPLVMAALREQQPPRVTPQMAAAITQSDNAAAEAVWTSLGDPPTAARMVAAVLAETGDPTQVQSERVRPGFSAFGQTEWSLINQAHFLSVAACDRRNTPILKLMGQIEQGQSWGLGTIARARFKGGWGPSPSDKYLARQMGLVSTPTGTSVVTVAAEPYSGSFDDGIRALDHVAGWLTDHVVMLPSGRCQH